MNGDITYNSNDLQTYDPATRVGIITNSIQHTNQPEKTMEIYAKANANGSAIPDINFPTRRISIAGVIKGSSQADLDDRIDTFNSYTNGKNKNLDIAYGSGTRRYIATPNSVSIDRREKALWAEFTIEFICTEPFGIDISSTSLISQSNYTSGAYTGTPTVAGSAPYQLPVITITIDALTGDGDYIQISNDNNGQDMLLYGLNLEAGDVIEIDAVNRTVKVNDVEVDYTGTFLELEPGANSITYSDGFATRTVDIEVEYYKRWL